MTRSRRKHASLKAAVIGYGGAFHMGKSHAGWLAAAGIPTIAVCDVDPARLRQAEEDLSGVRTYEAVADLLDDEEVGLCVVILPHNLHAEVAVACAEAGRHVVVEKPMCISVAEADAMIAAAREHGVMLSVFHNRRHDGDFKAIHDVIRRGIIGDVFLIEASIGGHGHPGHWWRSDKKVSGGALYDWGAHFLDWILHFVHSTVRGVTGFAQKRVWTDVTNEDHAQVIVSFENGCVAELQVSSLNRAPAPRWRILGTRGAIVDDWKEPFTVYTDHEGYRAVLQVPYQKTDWQAYYANIASHLRDGAELDVKPEEARRIIAILEAAERSTRSRVTEKPAYR
ncbi:MAG TPA: Gfo/Idh/MocA family oxidoreductase [Chthonomonadales bacterium]|nr:Gfo/Idh/MocA family oxidoreductase [Chthonomonadales bacterium]